MKTSKTNPKLKNAKIVAVTTLIASLAIFGMFVKYFNSGMDWSRTYTKGTNGICKTEICNTNHVNSLKQLAIGLLNNCGSFHLDLTILMFMSFVVIFILSLYLISLVRFFKKQEIDNKSKPN